MTAIETVEGDFSAGDHTFALLASRFNSFIVDSLVAGAIDTLRRHGVADKNITLYKAPGAYELPLLASKVAASKRHDAIIALGAVIRGGTPHFEYVAGECVKGLSQVSLNAAMPVAFGVLTVDTIEQAIERAGTKAGNKGSEAAASTLEMLNLLAKIQTAD